MKDEADDVRRLRAEVCVFNKKLFDYLEVSNILPIFAAEKNPPLYDKYLGQASARGLYF